MAILELSSNIDLPDDVYAMLVDAHRDLSDDASVALNVRLVLLLANHVGDAAVIAEAIAVAREDLAGPAH